MEASPLFFCLIEKAQIFLHCASFLFHSYQKLLYIFHHFIRAFILTLFFKVPSM